MSYIKVEGHTSLVRDVKSNAILNTSRSEFTAYMSKYKIREKTNDVLRGAVKEINTIKNEMKEINRLLTKVLNK